MAKSSGMGHQLLLSGYVLSNDIQSLSRIGGGPNNPLDFTGIDVSAMERKGGLLDAVIDLTAFFNPAAARAHARLGALPRTEQLVSYLAGTTLGDPAACLLAKQVNYDGTRGQDGSLMFNANNQGGSGYPLEWGEQLTAGVRTDTEATNGSSIDYGASTALGGVGYLHVTAFTGTSVAVTIEDSPDDSAWSTLLTFTAATGITFERIETGATDTVDQYVRAITTGTFSDAQFNVTFVRRLA